MKKIISIKIGLLVAVLSLSLNVKAQRSLLLIPKVIIVGSTSANVNDVLAYGIKNFSGATIYAASWSVTGGVIQSQSLTSATIKWTTAGTGSVQYVVTSSSNRFKQASLSVTVAASLAHNTPPNPTILSQVCTSAILQKSGIIPTGVVWYWQGTNSAGISTTYSAASNYNVTSSGTYYIRAKNTSSGVWSASSGFVSVALGTVGGATWYADVDGDGLGNPSVTLIQCSQPAGYVSNNSDQCPNDFGPASNNGCPILSALSNENYVRSINPQIPITDLSQLTSQSEVIQNVTYFDGLGRPEQSIAIKQSGVTQKDIIIHIGYDVFGRQDKDYLPYVPTLTGNDGTYRTDAVTVDSLFYNTSKYENTLNPYSQKLFESSPLNRVLQQAAPGNAWALGSGHEIKFDYQTNTTNEVRLFNVSESFANNTYTPTLTDNVLTYYPIGELYKTITKDENWQATDGVNHTTEEFKNKQGQVILKRTYNAGLPYDTYYVYDDYGNLTYVFPPKMEATTSSILTINSQLNELGYQYTYDNRNRLVEKRIPGKDLEYIVYDNLDRPVLTQDANQRLIYQWLFTKYDAFGRVAYTGIFTLLNSTRIALQTTFNAKTALQNYETKVTTGTGYAATYYTNNNYPNTSIEVLTVNYYDGYYFDLAGTFNPNTNNTLIYGIYPTLRTKGLAIGSKVKVLTTSNWITTVNYYDDKARSLRTYSYNDYLKATDLVSSQLDFVGKVKETTSSHTYINGNLATITTVDNLFYDTAGRLTKQTQTIGAHTETIVVNTYDELGQLLNKKVGNTETTPLQTVDYTYNIRGWLKQINNPTILGSDLFAFKLGYNEGAHPLYNGNIALTQWKTANTDNSLKTYTYGYDALNRITSGIDNTGHYNLTSVGYDKNGNITNLARKGQTDVNATLFGDMDILGYTYDAGNKLVKVADTGNVTYGFKDGANLATEYTYDANGNMKTDANKGIIAIQYNYLNLPTIVSFGSGNSINYVYDAYGVKLSKKISIMMSGTTYTQYAGNYIYQKHVPYVAYGGGSSICLGCTPPPPPADPVFELQFFNQPEGYVEPDGSGGFNYVYQYKDHLGNIRLSYADSNNDGVITASTEIKEENNYYPFGLKHKGYNNVQIGRDHKFEFQGQELTEDLDFNMYEFKYRMHDPAIGRFMQIDPLAEDYVHNGTYNFAENRVIDSRELEGLEAWQSTKNWTDEEIQGYSNAVAQRAEEYRGNGTTCTCEDFALNVLIDYASENGLPVTIDNGTGTYNSNSESFNNVSEFKDGVLVTTGASDLQNSSNTTQVVEGENSVNNAIAGDIILKRNDENVATHVQMVSSVEGDNVNIQQGNSGALNRVPGASRILGASNPNSSFYTGTKIQSGTYSKNDGSYTRNGNTTTNATKNFNLERRKWNFGAFNFRQKKN